MWPYYVNLCTHNVVIPNSKSVSGRPSGTAVRPRRAQSIVADVVLQTHSLPGEGHANTGQKTQGRYNTLMYRVEMRLMTVCTTIIWMTTLPSGRGFCMFYSVIGNKLLSTETSAVGRVVSFEVQVECSLMMFVVTQKVILKQYFSPLCFCHRVSILYLKCGASVRMQ